MELYLHSPIRLQDVVHISGTVLLSVQGELYFFPLPLQIHANLNSGFSIFTNNLRLVAPRRHNRKGPWISISPGSCIYPWLPRSLAIRNNRLQGENVWYSCKWSFTPWMRGGIEPRMAIDLLHISVRPTMSSADCATTNFSRKYLYSD
jgi:hypothetical protein